MMTATLRRSASAAMMLLRTNRSSIANAAAGSFVSELRSPTFLVASVDHLLEAFFIAARERPESRTEVVVQHERPPAEELLGEKFREHTVARRIVRAGPKEVHRVAVENERRGGPGKVEIGELGRPRGKPCGKLGAPARRFRRHGGGPVADRLREWPAVPGAGPRGPSGAAAR